MKEKQYNTKNISLVNEVVCDYFKVSISDIYSKNRTSKITLARGFIIFILHNNKKLSISTLSNEYKRIPRAIFWHCAKMRDYMDCYSEYRKIYDELCKHI